MKVSIVTVVGLLMVTFVFWIGEAEAQHRGGKGKGAVAHAPKGAARPGPARPHAPQVKAKAQHKAKGAMAKPAQKKPKAKESAKANHAEKKKHTAKETAKGLAKKAEKKAPAKVKGLAKKAEKKAPATKGGPDHESISLLRAAHHKLHEADHDYDGHRHRALEHVGSALGHLGSSAQAPMRAGQGRRNTPQSVSDAIMREARGSLDTIKNRLASLGASFKGHGEAHRAVDAAVREIDLALRVR